MNFFRTIAHIDLEALQNNLFLIKKTAPQSKIVAMVKSNAYGHGMVEIANTLRPRVDVLGVVNLQEALELIDNNVSARIVVWSGFFDAEELQTMSKFGLETVVHNFEQLALLATTELTNPIIVWLKIDTGMHRLGFQSHQIAIAQERLAAIKMVQKPLYYVTHFSDADLITSHKTSEQLACFKSLTSVWEGEKGIANSAAILRRVDTHLQWIRPGISLYGISPFPGIVGVELGLRPVMTLTSKIIALKDVHKGETVGYGSTWVCPQDTKIGIVAIGYGDGYPWHIKPGTKVLVDKKYYPIIGRVAMDFLCIDLTALSNVKIGAQVILWGEGLPLESIAEQAGTICYELPCQITRRVQYVYYHNSSDMYKQLSLRSE